jgi:ubiquinone/menaquinone biosynthesis C-methylase UbiE
MTNGEKQFAILPNENTSEKTGRGSRWLDVWNKKGTHTASTLFEFSGYNSLNNNEVNSLLQSIISPLNIQPYQSLLECGCGAGTVLDFLQVNYPEFNLYRGFDYSEELIARAKERFPNHCFDVFDFTNTNSKDVPIGLKNQQFDIVIAMGIFIYLDSEENARKALSFMLNMTKIDGQFVVAEQSDLAKRIAAERLRASTHSDNPKVLDLQTEELDHLYLPKSFFLNYGLQNNLDVIIKDHVNFAGTPGPCAAYRYSVYMKRRSIKK